MLAKAAREDLKELRANGYSPTDEDIIALNDLALRIERGQSTSPANHPRIGFAGDAVLHEPTVGALEWWLDYGRDAAFTTKGRVETYFFMFANARRVDYLQSLTQPKQIRKAVREWKRKVNATESELWRAVYWCKFGAEDMPEAAENDDSTLNDEQVKDALWESVVAAAGALGVPPEQLKTETQTALYDAVYQVNIRARIPMKQSIARDYMAYRALLHKIESRGKDNG